MTRGAAAGRGSAGGLDRRDSFKQSILPCGDCTGPFARRSRSSPAALTLNSLGLRGRPADRWRRHGRSLAGLASGRQELLEAGVVADRVEVPVVPGQDPVALVLLDRLAQVLEGDLELAGLGVAAGEQEIDSTAAVLSGSPLQMLDRLEHLAAVLREHGRVVEILRLRESGIRGLLLALANRQVHPRPVAQLLLVGVLLGQLLEVALCLLDLPALQGGDAAVELFAGVLGVARELFERLRLSGGSRLRRAATDLLELLLQVIASDRQRLGQSLNTHLADVVPDE